MNTNSHPYAIRFLSVSIFTLLLLSCSSQKTEQEQYQDASSGFTYETYKAASKVAVVSSVKVYNYNQPDSVQLNTAFVHLLLGYSWSVAGKPSLAFAEADLAEEKSDTNLKFLAQSLRSITMYQQGWHTLANEESKMAHQNLKQGYESDVVYEAVIFYLIMGTLHVKEKDFEQAKFFWAGFGNETGIHWPYQLCDAAADLQAGKVQQGLQKIKLLTQDPSVPQSLREALKIEIEKIEVHAGTTVDSSLFWPKLIAGLLWDEIQNSSTGSLQKIATLVTDIKKKLPA